MIRPPVAKRRKHRYTHHGITLEDPYYWLRDPAYPDVKDSEIIDYLKAENAYFDARMEAYQPLVTQLFEEIKGRQPAEDASVPHRHGAFWYQWRYQKDAQYRQWLRAPAPAGSPPDAGSWEVILDEPELAREHPYFSLGGISMSRSGRFMAWSADTSGAERFTLRIRDLQTGELVDDPIEQTQGSPVWAADDACFFYVVVNDQWRPYQVRRHRLGDPPDADAVVYEEREDSFFVSVDETQSEAYILIAAGDHVTSEIRYVPADEPLAEPALIARRRAGHEYEVDHRDGAFYIVTNDGHKNFRLARAPEDDPVEQNWQTVIEGSENHYLTGLLCLKDHLVVCERIDGLDQIRIRTDEEEHHVVFPESAYAVGLGANAEYDSATLRLHYESMVTPSTVYDYDIARRKLIKRKVREIPTGYDRTRYETERRTVTARDGAQIPLSIVYRRDFPRDGTAPVHLYSYGAYGHAMSPTFSPSRLSLLDRGFAFAVAHVRGGDDLGRQWYEDGKLDKRTNTFNDFVDCARHLIDSGFSSPGRIVISGGSAGGELMGAAINAAPTLWGAVVAHVPFVDVLSTMLDASLPLTPIEWPEWGNPIEDKAAFELIRSYSPYDQLAPGAYPPILVTAGLNDPRVTYWEAAKYVAKLRHLKTDENWLLLKTNMSAGHSGESGRFDSLREVAEEYAFFLVSLEAAGWHPRGEDDQA
jgi:oligopeptidase B